MAHNVGRGFWVRPALTLISTAVFFVTLSWHDWIEIVFRVDHDHGSGWLEWLIVVIAFGLTLTFSISARRKWRRSVSIATVADGVS
jgi:hypothetical protein